MDALIDNNDSDSEPPATEQPRPPTRDFRAIIACLTVVVVVFVATGGFAAGSVYTHLSSGVTPAVAQLVLSSNTSADVCSDPWAFACGGFEDTHYRLGSAIGGFQQRVDAHLQRVLDMQHNNGGAAESAASVFFARCQTDAVSPPFNETALWFWQRGFAVANITVGRGINPARQYETVPYVEVAGPSANNVPLVVHAVSNSTCDAYLVGLVRNVSQLSLVTHILVYGDYGAFCEAADWPAQTNMYTTVPVARSASMCLMYTQKFWGGYMSTLTSALMPSTQHDAVQKVFATVQAEFLHRLVAYPSLHAKVSAISCETVYIAAVESYAEISHADFNTVFYNLRRQLFEHDVHASSIEPVWHMRASSVNAYYSQLDNKLYLLPAMAMYLHDLSESAAQVYGRLGYIIGHEIGHAVDSNGVQFDASGTFTPETILQSTAARDKLEEDVRCFDTEFGTNGRTTDEDIADHLGIQVVRSIMMKQPPAKSVRICAPTCVELNTMAQFYMFFAQTWCSAKDVEVNTDDVHSPGKQRVTHALARTHANGVFGCAQPVPPPPVCSIYNI